MRRFLIWFFLALIFGGALAVSGSFAHPEELKVPLMIAGMTGLAMIYLPNLKPSQALVPFLACWLLAYFRLTRYAAFSEASLAEVGVLLAFLLGFMKAPLAHRMLLPPVVLLCVVRGLVDLITMTHLGAAAPLAAQSLIDSAQTFNVVSFFSDKRLFGAMMILGAFHHFYLMEKRDPHKPVQVILYTSSLLVLLSVLLVDSRIVQGVFFFCFLPLMFLSVRLDGREPRLERLAWSTGITLSLGLAWINLPEMQLHRMASLLSPSTPGFLPWAWATAWRTFLTAPLIGKGIGGFRYAASAHEGRWPSLGGDSDLPVLGHAHNHFLETLAEGGLVFLLLELLLLAGAFWGFARIYYREWNLEAKYGFFALAALCLLGLFCPVLEQAPARFAYWALIGFGWSHLAGALPVRQLSFTAKALMGGAIASLACLHLYLRIPELISDRLYAHASQVVETDPRASTDLLVEAMRLNPGNEAACYAYTEVLTDFGRENDAINMIGFVQKFAPDERKRAEALAHVYAQLGRADSAAKYASAVLDWYPDNLPALEILMGAYRVRGQCAAIDSLSKATQAMNAAYPMPLSSQYTIAGLDSLFRSNSEVIFLQRWFGGQALRQRFVERRMDAYSQRIKDHERLESLNAARCPGPASDSIPKPRPLRNFWHIRGWA